MLHSKIIFLLIFANSFYLISENKQKILFTEQEISMANTAANASWLSDEEKKVILYMNLARMNGEKFYMSYIPDYIINHNKVFSPKISRSNRYLKSLKSDLRDVKNLPMLYPDSILSMAAAFHVKDMGESGRLGHDSSDGTTFSERLHRYSENISFAAENCSYGSSGALNIVCSLLLDIGVPSLGHRINILTPDFNFVGTSIGYHRTYRINCVIDFSGL